MFVLANQTSDIWNISGRVNQQDGAVTSEPRWPTHDHHLSIDSFGLAENLQSQKKDRVPPPPYCEGMYTFCLSSIPNFVKRSITKFLT